MRESTFLYLRPVLGQVGQITFEKDLDLQVEIAVMDSWGMCWKMGKEYFWDLREECLTGLNEILTTYSH